MIYPARARKLLTVALLVINGLPTAMASDWLTEIPHDISSCPGRPNIFPWFYKSDTIGYDSITFLKDGVDIKFRILRDGTTAVADPINFNTSLYCNVTNEVNEIYRRLPGKTSTSVPASDEHCAIIYLDRIISVTENYTNEVSILSDPLPGPHEMSVTYASSYPDPTTFPALMKIDNKTVASEVDTVTSSKIDTTFEVAAVTVTTPEQVELRVYHEGTLEKACNLQTPCTGTVSTGENNAELKFYFFYSCFEASPFIVTVTKEFSVDDVDGCGISISAIAFGSILCILDGVFIVSVAIIQGIPEAMKERGWPNGLNLVLCISVSLDTAVVITLLILQGTIETCVGDLYVAGLSIGIIGVVVSGGVYTIVCIIKCGSPASPEVEPERATSAKSNQVSPGEKAPGTSTAEKTESGDVNKSS